MPITKSHFKGIGRKATGICEANCQYKQSYQLVTEIYTVKTHGSFKLVVNLTLFAFNHECISDYL